MINDVIYNKVRTIERCILRIEEVYANDEANLKDYTKQDSVILNIQRACEAAIDLAMHIVAENKLGLPQKSREAFELLEDAAILEEKLATNLKAMVGFRNIAIHDYQAINLLILKQIIEKHLNDFMEFTKVILKYMN